jgi:hypothetical protein
VSLSCAAALHTSNKKARHGRRTDFIFLTSRAAQGS